MGLESLVKDLAEGLGFDGKSKLWSLTPITTLKESNKPDKKTSIIGKFPPINYTESLGARIVETSTVGKNEPFPIWVGGTKEIATFTGRLFARDSFEDITKDLKFLKASVKKNRDKKNTKYHASFFIFRWGSQIEFNCIVQDLSEIVYDEVRNDGKVRGVTFNITLRVIGKNELLAQGVSIASIVKSGTAFAFGATVSVLPSTSPFAKLGTKGKVAALGGLVGVAGGALAGKLISVPGASLFTIRKIHVAKLGDTFESIADQEYDDALKGDALRRAQPEKLDIAVGDVIAIIDEDEIEDIEITQQIVVLKNERNSIAVKNEFFALRGGSKIIPS